MLLRLRLLFGLCALLSIPACSSADSSSAGGGEARASAGGAAVASGGSRDAYNWAESGNGGGTALVGSPAAGASVASTAPVTWNSAKSVSLTDAQLAVEYGAWKVAHVESCSNGSSVVVKDGAVVSQGIGFGLLLSATMADQPLFDGLWKYYQDHADKNGLMNASTNKCEAPGNNNAGAETDADLDTAMALVQAASRWPNGGYLPKAQALSNKIADLESEMCSGRRVLRPGDAFGGCSDTSDPRINPSYFAPGYYKVFAHYFPDQASTWTALSDGSYQLYALYQARMDNLVPDSSGPDGSDDGSDYSVNASRTPFRVAVDYAWTGDIRAKTFMRNISTWVDGHGGLPSAAPLQNSAFVGSFALAGGYDQAKFDGYVMSWLEASLDDTEYYSGTLRVLYLLVAAGKFSSTL